ncbi:uncharacterized protein LOC133791639 [Humulus lupulus]|uniref:uncharacterized protein LOC133791639 n=1 Tax=Humulus lupulus TaxID=3486 RepID=UPI002B40C3B9|nr:uncharacterized protein LOC133791639 [Humulus lupulus]
MNATQYQQLLNIFANQQNGKAHPNINNVGETSRTILSATHPLNFKNEIWIFDSGATRHICSNISFFISIVNIPTVHLILLDNSILQVNQCGTILLTDNITLTKELSIMRMVGKGRLQNDLYIFEQPYTSACINFFFISLNVVFHETIFPFTSLNNATVCIDPFPQHVLPSSTVTNTNIMGFHPSSTTNHESELQQDGNNVALDSTEDIHVDNMNDLKIQICILQTIQVLLLLHKNFILAVSTQNEPSSYKDAILNNNWIQAMNLELKALQENKTWTIVPLPSNIQPIGCHWVCKVKYHNDGTIERYKARLVAQAYTQQEGLDYFDTFSPIAKMVTLKLLLAVSTIKHWTTIQLDINNAFLNGDLNEDIYIYMKIPPDLLTDSSSSSGTPLACKLHKSIYGLKQSSRRWYTKLSDALL